MSYIDHELETPNPLYGFIVASETNADDPFELGARFRLTVEFEYDASLVEFIQYLKQLRRIAKRGDGRLNGSGLPWVILSAPEKKEPRQ